MFRSGNEQQLVEEQRGVAFPERGLPPGVALQQVGHDVRTNETAFVLKRLLDKQHAINGQ